MRALEQLSAQQRIATSSTPRSQRLQWLIEELRVSLFAQDLRTAVPVSEKRIQEQIERRSGRDFEIDALRERQLRLQLIVFVWRRM